MSPGTLLEMILERARPAPVLVPAAWCLVALGLAALVVIVPGLWRAARPAVTIVHELGHAITGILAGRRFTGFVVNGDMSGHAVTVGRDRGVGRVVSAWAGYPAPAVLGSVLVALGAGPWGRPVLAAALAVLLISLVFVRSLHTLAVVLGSVLALGALWWWGAPALVGAALLGLGALLLLGAWRHLGAVIAHGGRRDDPGQLARLTGVPAGVWIASHVIVLAGASWWAGSSLLARLPSLPLPLGAA